MTVIKQHYRRMIIRTLSVLAMTSLLVACGRDSELKDTPAAPKAQEAVISQVKAERTPMDRGRILYKRCQACHTLEDGGKHKVGPNLWGIYGMTTGTKDGFAYSKAMQASDVVWDDATMDAYIEKPRDFMPGNKMSFIGIKKAEDRADLLLYMKAQTGAQ